MALRLAEDLNCPICQEIFSDPVVLSCSHSFCKFCIKSWWRRKQTWECPVCKRASKTIQPPSNLALRNLCETFRQIVRRDSRGSQTLCLQHFERFKLYCLDHREPACVVCRDSSAHLNHRFRPVDEIAGERKEQIRACLVPIQEELRLLKHARKNFIEAEEHIKIQARHTEEKIRDEFQKLREIILKEKKARIAALKVEEKNKTMHMSKQIAALSKEITALSDAVRVTKEELSSDDVSFLRSFNSAVQRLQRPLLPNTEMVSGALIDVAQHLKNLTNPVLNQLKEKISRIPVILDPNTAHPHLILSEDLTSVRYGKRQKLPKNRERIDYYRCVLGSEGFSSGSHSWDVQVGGSSHWLLGVAAEKSYRNKHIKSGLWILKFDRHRYSALSPQGEVELHKIQRSFEKIRVHLNWNRRGRLSFSDPETGTHIHTFTHTSHDTLFPYFSNGKRSPLKILPVPDPKGMPTPMKVILAMMMMVVVVMMTAFALFLILVIL